MSLPPSVAEVAAATLRKYADLHMAASRRLRLRNDALGPLAQSERARAVWARGFVADKLALYDFERWDIADYVSDLQHEMTRVINGQYSVVLDDKALLDQVLPPEIRRPPVLLAVSGAQVLRQAENWGEIIGAMTPTMAYVKPIASGMGHNVVRVALGQGRMRRLGVDIPIDAFLRDVAVGGGAYVITGAVEQDPWLSAIHPGTTNTIRLLMIRDRTTNRGTVEAALSRFGTRVSGDVDNFQRGGVVFQVDTITGELGPGFQRRDGERPRLVTSHPDTGVAISGRAIPRWDEVLAAGMAAFEALPFLRYVGWDLLLEPEGVAVIEGNSFAGVMAPQVFGPLLANPRLRAFFEGHGVLAFTGPCMRLTHRSSALLKALNDSRERVAASPLRHGPRS